MKTEPSADLLMFCLREIYQREMQLGEFLPMFSSITSDPELRELICEQIQSTENRTAGLLAILEAHEVSPCESGSDAIRSMISGANMQLADVEDPPVRDLLIAAHYLRIGHDGISIYRDAASLARLAGSLDTWVLLANSYADQETTVCCLDGIGARLFANQMRDPDLNRKVA